MDMWIVSYKMVTMLSTLLILTICGVTRAGITGLSRGDDYCAVDPKHTMCLYQGPSAECTANTFSRVFTPVGQDAILSALNEVRRTLAHGQQWGQPPAANMKKVTWDKELAIIAQRWADQCKYKHDKKRNTLDKTYVGQNIRKAAFTAQEGYDGSKDEDEINETAGDAVYDWYDEVEFPGFHAKDINPFHMEHGRGHYTQTAWADTNKVGCGYTHYKNGQWFETLIVCNFSPGGNMGGAPMYLEGEACSLCGEGSSARMDSVWSKYTWSFN